MILALRARARCDGSAASCNGPEITTTLRGHTTLVVRPSLETKRHHIKKRENARRAKRGCGIYVPGVTDDAAPDASFIRILDAGSRAVVVRVVCEESFTDQSVAEREIIREMLTAGVVPASLLALTAIGGRVQVQSDEWICALGRERNFILGYALISRWLESISDDG